MSDFTNSAAYKRYQSILDLPDNGSQEMAKAKEVARNKLSELGTSQMAKQAGVEDPFAKATKTTSSRGGAGAGGGGADMEMMHGMLMPNPKANYKKGGKVKLFKHHDGIAQKGKTRA